MKEGFIRIQSTMNITVTGGLQGQDVTNKDAHVPDRLKVQPLWPKLTVDIHEGVGTYPAYIVEWNTVKALVKEKVLTIGVHTMEPDTDKDAEVKENLDTNIEEIDKVLNKKKNVKLSDLAGE